MNKNLTIRDISVLCGVSRQTVSRVLNNSGYVKEETRKKILNIIEKYNYKPNPYARNLAGNKKNKNILLSIKTNLSSSASIWLNMLVNNIISVNKNKNITIITEQYYDLEDYERSLLNTTNGFVDGVIIFYEEENDERIKMLKKSNIPYIIYGKAYNDKDICVGLDNEDFIIMATEYFFSKQLYEISFLSALPSPVNISREEGIIKAYKKNGIDLNKLNIVKNFTNQKELYDYTKNLYELKKMPEVLFVSGDEKAIGVLNALNELGVKIPEEVSVMGVDNIPMSEYLTPSLSTVGFDYNKIAKTILKKILNMIEGKEEKSEYFKGNLIIRGSTK